MARKGGPKFYAVRVGKKPGVYTSWDEASDQVTGFGGAIREILFLHDAYLTLTDLHRQKLSHPQGSTRLVQRGPLFFKHDKPAG